MKSTRHLLVAAALMLVIGGRFVGGQHGPLATDHRTAMAPAAATSSFAVRGTLPTEATAKFVLNTMVRHREWAEMPAGAGVIRTFVVYPDRANKAPIVEVTSRDQGLTDWVRAVSDQVAADGFIAVAPDVSGDEVARRTATVRDYFSGALPLANGRFASLNLSRNADGTARADIAVDPLTQTTREGSFTLTAETWSTAVAFLNRETNNRPVGVPSEAEMRATDMAMGAMAMNDMGFMMNLSPGDALAMDVVEAQAQAQSGGREPHSGAANTDDSVMTSKRPDMPASIYMSRATMLHTPMKGEWVNIPVGNVQLHTWISYPAGTGKAPIALVIHGAAGLWEDWPQAVADQLAREGFIGVAMDLRSGQGPNGGNFDYHFPHLDDGLKPGPDLGPGENMRRVKAARDYALGLPRSNGKSATMGFCAGGGLSWNATIEIPGLNAAVSFYGNAPNEAAMAKIVAPVYAFQGEFDGRISANAPAVIASMAKFGKTFHSITYPKTTHSFVSQQNVADNYRSLLDSWPKAIAFMKQHTM